MQFNSQALQALTEASITIDEEEEEEAINVVARLRLLLVVAAEHRHLASADTHHLMTSLKAFLGS